jgi:hypothetical protein
LINIFICQQYFVALKKDAFNLFASGLQSPTIAGVLRFRAIRRKQSKKMVIKQKTGSTSCFLNNCMGTNFVGLIKLEPVLEAV